MKKKKPGRPEGYSVPNPAKKTLPVRFTETQIDNYRLAAEKSEKSLSDWARSTLDDAAKQVK